MNAIDVVEKLNMRKKPLHFSVGDTVDVHVKIKEGEKERVQLFNGIVIAKQGGGMRECFVVRRIVQGEGVERIFPVHSPKVLKVVVKKSGATRRAKLYFLRDRVGKATRLREVKGIVVPSDDLEVPADGTTPVVTPGAEAVTPSSSPREEPVKV